MRGFENANWWKYLDEPMKDLMNESFHLLEHARKEHNGREHDYSYIVFPAAKAYEGFLKKLFFDLKLINKSQYVGDRFRIGRSLNPHLPKRYQWDWVYERLVSLYGGELLPLRLWETWKLARNRVFHYFPGSHEIVTLAQAQQLVESIVEAVDKGFSGKFRIQ